MEIPNNVNCAYDEEMQALMVETVGTASAPSRSKLGETAIWHAVCDEDAMAIRVVFA